MFDHKSFLATLTARPGVYCMRDKTGEALYVGKAKNLKNRVSNYFRGNVDLKTAKLVKKITQIDITVTASEKEALLLENSLIKSLDPRYNVIFKDDKSYPYLFISDHEFPRLVYMRGKQKFKGKYFGPYPSTTAVKQTLGVLQKIFKIRQCDDTFFKNRSRPCLQYQISRCTAPCVNYITQQEYAQDVENVILFLQGKERSIADTLVQKMQQAAENCDFELAAHFRDQITSLHAVTEQQAVERQEGNFDVLGLVEYNGQYCIQLLYIRYGQILDTHSFYPKQIGEGDKAEILRGFITQFYLDTDSNLDYPSELIINETIEDEDLISDALTQLGGKSVKLTRPTRGQKTKWLTMACHSAQEALVRRVHQRGMVEQRWQDLKQVLGITNGLTRMECFDISHTQGEATMASCVVFTEAGPDKGEYRRYNLDVPANDDYAAMEQVITKRYLKRKAEDLPMPELIIVDGGKGQLHRAQKALLECQIIDVILMGIAKGEGRKAGLETLYVIKPNSEEELMIKLPPMSKAFHLLQHIRDEAHRFAISGHRQKRAKTRKTSTLESIPGIGPKRRQQLLNYFGGLQGLTAASEAAIAGVPGISPALAKVIYNVLHENLLK